MASWLNRLWSGTDFWDKEENQKQRQQFAQTRAQQQPRPVVQTKSAPTLQNNRNVQPRVRDQITRPTIRTVDNAPGFQWSNNSLTRGLSRGFDQLNPLDSGRSWQTRTPSEEQKQQSGLSQAGKIVAPATGRFLNTAALGGEQIWNTGRMYAAQMSKNPLAFRNANQAALDDYKRYTKEGSGVFGAGSFFKTPEEASSGDLKTVAKRIGGGTLESATEVGSMGLGGFVGKKLLQQGVRQGITSQIPTLAKNAVLNAVQGGASAYNQDADVRDIAKSAAIGAGLGTAADVGLGVSGAVVAQAAKPVVKTTTRLASQTLDKVAPVQTTTRLVKRTNRLDLDTTDALKAYSDRLVGADPYITGKVESDLIAKVRNIGDQLGVDLTNGSVADQMERIEAILNGYLPMTEARRQLAIPEVSADYDPKYTSTNRTGIRNTQLKNTPSKIAPDGRSVKGTDGSIPSNTNVVNLSTNGATSRPAQSPQPTKQPQGQLSGSTSPYQNPSLPDTPAKPNTQTLVQTPEVKSKQVSGQPSDTGISPSKVKDKQLRDLQTVRKQLIDAETDAILESGRPQRNLIKEVLDAGGISSSAYETLPKGVRRKSGMSADRVAQELGFDSEDSLIQALNDYAANPNRKMTRSQAREQAIELLESGKSQYDEDWKLLQQKTGERQLELDRLNASRITESKPQKQAFPSYEEFEALTKSAEAQNPANKTKRSVAAASSELRASQKQAVLEGDIKKANAIREKVGEIEKGLKRTPPDLSKSAEELIHDIPEIKDIKGKTNKAVKERFMAKANTYLGERRAATYSAVDKARTFNNEFPDLTDAQRLEIIHAADQASYKSKDPVVNKAVKRLHEQYDQAYRYFTKERGINMGYQHSYYPRTYKHPKTGELINSVEFDLLQRASSRQKGRTSDIIASDFLVTKDPAEALTMYHRSLENAAAGKKFMNELEQDGLVVYSTEPVRGMRPVVAEGMQDAGGVYYARPEVAKSLDRMFGTQEASGAFEKIVENGQGLNSFVQSLVLSGGIPNTPVNAFGFMQVMKSSMAGHPIQAGKAFLKSLGRKQSDNFFKANSDVLQEMARNGLDVRVNYQAKYRNMFGRIKDSAQGGRRKMVAEAWDQFTNDATFQRFMPMLETMHYKQIRDGLVKRGAKPEVAAKRAADATSNFFGKTKLATQATRSKVGQDALGAVAFAPRFRESMVNFWGKNLQSVKPGNWGKAEWRANQAFIMAAAATWAGMEGANMALNGNWMHDNPDGKKDKLLIPGLTSDGKDVGIPFLPSIATVPRNAAMGLFNAATGKFEEAGKNLQSFASMPLKTGIETFTNENYFGQRIVDEDASALEKLGQMGSHIAKSNMQPWVREGLNVAGQNLPDGVKKTLGIKEKSGFETASNALEAPLRFYDPKYYKGGQGKLVANSVFSDNKSKKIGVTTEKNKYGDITSRDKYDTVIDAYEKNKDGTIRVNEYDTDQLRSTIKDLTKEYNSTLKSAGLREIKGDSRHAVDYAKFVKSIEGKDELEVQNLSKNFYRNSYKKEMDKRTQAFYKLSDDAMRTAIQKGQVSKDQLVKAVEIDNYLTETGLQSYYQIGKKLRAELGITGGSTGRSGGRRSGGRRGSGGGRKSRLSFEPFKFAKKSSHLNKELRALIEAAGAPSKAFPKAKKTPNYS